jgi:hypothetical protein
MKLSVCRRSIVRWPTLLVVLLLPVLAQAEGGSAVASVDTEHIFGFTDGTDIGDKGDIELERTVTGAVLSFSQFR